MFDDDIKKPKCLAWVFFDIMFLVVFLRDIVMKILKIFAVCVLLATSGQGFAKTTPIKFAKGSMCGVFTGDTKGRKFTLHLKAGQTLLISDMTGDWIYSVRDPKGKKLKTQTDIDGTMTSIKTTGVHTITLSHIYEETDVETRESIEFCAS